MEVISRKEFCRLKQRPYYAVLYAINKLKSRLPAKLEEALATDAESCLLYAENVIKGKLPDNLHNAMILTNWGSTECKEAVVEYLKFIKKG